MYFSNNRFLSAVMVVIAGLAASGSVSATLTITEVDLANDKAEFVNLTTNTVDASSWWLCNRVNGSPFYPTMASATIDTNLSTATSLVVGPGELLVLEISGLLPDPNGELGTYNVNSFGSASAIEDYVAWGGEGFRDGVAAVAGIWVLDEFIDVSGIGVGETFQLTFGQPGDSAVDYFIGPSTLGSFEAPVPTNAPLMSIEVSSPGFVEISWEPSDQGFVLQETDSLGSASWANSPSGTNNPALVPTTEAGKLYRVRKP